MGDEHVVFLERPCVTQHVDTLSGGKFPLGMLRVDTLLPAPRARFGTAGFELFDDGGGHGVRLPGVVGETVAGRAGEFNLGLEAFYERCDSVRKFPYIQLCDFHEKKPI